MAVIFSGGWDKLKGLFSGSSITNRDIGAQHDGPHGRSNDANLSFSDQRAMQLTAVWSCVRLITETVGSLPLSVYERTSDGRNTVDDHYLYDLFRVSPNALMTPLEFREAMVAQVVLWGNAYALIEWSGEEPVSISPLRPECMTPMRATGGMTYHYSTDTGVRVFAAKSILHIKGFGFDGTVGLSPLGYASQSMGVSLSADKYAAKAFSSGGRPVGVLTFDAFLNTDQRAQARKVHASISADDADGTWVLEGGSQYKPITLNPNDLQMLESRKFQLGEIARIFRVPSYLINDTEKSTSWGTGIEQQNLGFLTYTIRPYLTRIESAINSALLDRTDRRKYFVEHNVEGLLRADSAARSQFYSTALQNGWMNRDEVRNKENLGPMPGGQIFTAQLNLTPVEQLPKVKEDVGV